MNNGQLSIGDMASALGGAGLTQINGDLKIALLLIGVAVVLKVVIAILTHENIVVSSPQG